MIPKRTLAELILLYEKEPSLIDVFCEGPGDNAILRSFVEAIETRKTAVYDAEQIEWPDDVYFEGGNRSKIAFLSEELSSRQLNGVCVIDRDLDTIEDRTPVNMSLLKTDYASIDMYGLDADDLIAFLFSTFNVALTGEQISSIFDACKRLFLIRYLRDKHAAGSSIADARRIMISEEEIKLGVKEYLSRCKQLNGYDARWDKVIENEEAQFHLLNGDFRDHINIHDLGDILVAAIRALKRKSVTIDQGFVAKHCAYVLLSTKNFGYPLFSGLSQKLA